MASHVCPICFDSIRIAEVLWTLCGEHMVELSASASGDTHIPKVTGSVARA